MSFRTFFKIISALTVIVIMGFTGMLAYHVVVAPLDGIFAKIIPNPGSVHHARSNEDFAKMLESTEMPDIDPGEKAFQKAHELLVLGKLNEAREKLTAIVNIFPSSSSAPIARHIVSEMNLDEIFSTSHMEGKQIHVVKRGDSYLAIVGKYNTTIDSMMHLNAMTELRGIQPGDELVIMPLNFRMLIESRRKSISLWNGGRFLCEYPALSMGTIPATTQRGTISSKTAEIDGKRVLPQSKNYRAAKKEIQITKPTLHIRAWDGISEKPANGILLRPQDLEEINLLTHIGNEVEIR